MVLKREFPFPSKKDGVPKLVAKNLAYFDDQIRLVFDYTHIFSFVFIKISSKITAKLKKFFIWKAYPVVKLR